MSQPTPFDFGEPDIVPSQERKPVSINVNASGDVRHEHRARGSFFAGLGGGAGLALGIVIVLTAVSVAGYYGIKWWFRSTVAEIKDDLKQAREETQKRHDSYPRAVAGKETLNIDGVKCEVTGVVLDGDYVNVSFKLKSFIKESVLNKRMSQACCEPLI